jgi:Na+-transporting NADH:ubiquinone oxidoreductase subunit NqrB
LLLRTNSLWFVVAAVIVTIGSKFVLRWRGKHIFNPTNFGLVAMMIATDQAVWVSPGQWGNVAFFGFLMACIGGLVVNRAARTDVTVAFLAFHIVLVFGRSAYLGEPITIPLHRLQSGALLHFRFLHGVGSQDDARLASRSHSFCRTGRAQARGSCNSAFSRPMDCSGHSQSSPCLCR